MADVIQFPGRQSTESSKHVVSEATPGFVAHRLIEARLVREMSREELGRQIGVTGQAIGYYEGGDRRPDMGILLRLAEALEQPVTFFLHGGDAQPTTFGTRFFRSVGPKSKKLNLALDVTTKWLWECVTRISCSVRLPALNLPLIERVDEPFTRKDVERIAQETRRFWGLGDGPIANIVALLETNGVVVTRFELNNDNIDAFSTWIEGRPFIILSSDKTSACRSRFDAAHELGHILLHRSIEQDDLSTKKIRDQAEQEAHWFASAFLIPRTALLVEFYSTRSTHLVGLKRRWLVSMGAIVYACKDIGLIDEGQYILFRKTLAKNNWLKNEALDDQIPLERPSLLLKAVRMLVDKGVLTETGFQSGIGFPLEFIQKLCGFVPKPASEFGPHLSLLPT